MIRRARSWLLGALLACPAVDAAERELEEIIVTAEKRAERLQDVPVSVSAFRGELMRDSGADNLHDLAELTPNVTFTTNPCCMIALIRGFGTPFAVSAFEPTVGLVVDELLLPRDAYMADPLYDLERFEVLRGPQGTLFGKNTPAGLFNVVTAKPTEEFDGYVLGRIGGLGTHRFEGAIGGPIGTLGNIARFRLAGVESRQAGDVHNTKIDDDEPAAEQRAARLSLSFGPFDGLEISLLGSYATTESRLHIQLHDLEPSTLEFLRPSDPRVEDDGFDHRSSSDLEDVPERNTHALQANVRYGLERWLPIGEPALVAIVGLSGFDADRVLDVDFSPADIARQASPADFEWDQLSAEIRFSGTVGAPFGLGRLEMLAGGFVLESELRSLSPIVAGEDFDEYLLSAPAFELLTGMPAPGGIGFEDVDTILAALALDPLADVRALEGDGGRILLDQDASSRALFGNLVWHLTPEWALGIGARVTFEEKDAHLFNECVPLGVVCTILGIQEFDVHRDRDETDFSPKVMLQYFPAETLSLFATYAQGFKGGGFNNLSFTTADLEVGPEETVSWEVGARGTLLSRRFAYGATLFHMDVDDLQLQAISAGQVQVRNAASARSRGAELDLQWLTPWQPLTLRGAGAVTDARFDEFRNAPAVASSMATSQDLSGRRIPFVSKTQLMFTPELRLPLESLIDRDLVLLLATDVLYRSSHFLDVDLDPNTRQESYVMLDARLHIGPLDGPWSAGVSVENVTNADVLEYATDSLVFPGGYTVLQEFQRNYSFEVRYAF